MIQDIEKTIGIIARNLVQKKTGLRPYRVETGSNKISKVK